jgi:hypothetical protein
VKALDERYLHVVVITRKSNTHFKRKFFCVQRCGRNTYFSIIFATSVFWLEEMVSTIWCRSPKCRKTKRRNKFWKCQIHLTPFDILLFNILLFDILLFDILSFIILLIDILLFNILSFNILLFDILSFNILLFDILSFNILLFDKKSYYRRNNRLSKSLSKIN